MAIHIESSADRLNRYPTTLHAERPRRVLIDIENRLPLRQQDVTLIGIEVHGDDGIGIELHDRAVLKHNRALFAKPGDVLPRGVQRRPEADHDTYRHRDQHYRRKPGATPIASVSGTGGWRIWLMAR